MTYAHQALSAKTAPLPAPENRVASAIARASAKTGVDFSYLMSKASVESSLNPTAKAKNSSATGLFQFVEKTWLEMIRDYGHKYGLSRYAECIDDNCHVKNARIRKAILDLRHDPETSACMAAEYAAQNADTLKARVGDNAQIGRTELYLAHFLGAGGATRFLQGMERNPDARAATLFPAEARVNRGVFYNSETGRARTLQEIYDHFAAKFDAAPPKLGESEIAMQINRTPARPARATTIPGMKPDLSADTYNKNTATNDIDPLAGEWVEGTPIAALSPEFVDELLAAPPRLLGSFTPETAPTPAAHGVVPEKMARAVPTPTITRTLSTASLHQAALLVLAQNYAHEDQRRYNG